ncbi:S9 family peptidase [Nigerium massiliense]|uniref:S9 family peptidase n=1 Tax=Nigerium massiliense TaxID=1522317 RepID=UPI00058DA84F|nr:S9 family peptidase [Nigerium massiliense]
MRPVDLPLFTSVSAPFVAPDHAWAVVSVTHPDLAADAYVGQLWRVDLTGEREPRRLTRGFSDVRPRVSPDGSLVGFLRSQPGGAPQVHILPTDGGEAVQVTDQKLGVLEFEFSPDGGTIAFIARVPEDGRYGTLEGVEARAEDPRHITTLKYSANGLGWTNDRRRHVFVVETPDPFGAPAVTPVGRAARDLGTDTPPSAVPDARQITDGDYDHWAPCFTPDGQALIVTSARHETRDLDLVTNLYRLRKGDDPTLIETPSTADDACFSADGQTLFFIGEDLGADGLDFVGHSAGVFAMPADGGEARRLTDTALHVSGPLRPAGPDGVLALANVRGHSTLVRVSAGGDVDVWEEDSAVLAAADAGSMGVLATVTDPSTPAELALLDDRGETRLTDVNGPLRAACEPVVPAELEASSRDGYPVHGWVFTPVGPGPHPVVLAIHGGPFASYSADFFDEFQVLVEAGYAVVACNPRGAAGYGEEHGRATRGDFGNLDAADVLAFLDHALEVSPGLDASRVGVMGGSYGGYLTAWIIAHDHRFAGAIVERGFLDPASFIGPSDIGSFFVAQYNGADLDRLNAQSPTLLTDQVTTPTLVIHSEDDLRCPLSQALRYYTRLKQAGADAELLVFPGENHELSRSGTPQHRLQRFDAILAFWARHLPTAHSSKA